jgi:flagellar hook-associated protein 2
MGTVGLSFGSPTSGTGFDVSTTVSSIVANLENVETPWKTQLTSLESQDTAISSLGTLFSNLSNDLSSLTDFEGVMAEKTGSSSDTNVLSLTAADSSAIAGTHTVEVTNLAQTSSGYLAPVSNSSDTLTGSITLKVGSGTAETISVPTASGKNTLAGLAAAINASGVGIDASVLTDSSGSRLSLVSGTSGAGGDIAISANSIAAAASGTLSYTAAAGSTASGTLSPVGSLSDVLTGSIAIGVGGGTAQTVSLGSAGETLQQLADAINDPTTGVAGVTASIATNSDGSSSLSLSSSAGALSVTSSVTDPSSLLGYTSTVNGKNANLTVDGVNLTSSSNTVSNLIPGVTFQLLSVSPTTSGNPETVQVVIGNDNTGVESTVNQMVSDYNALMSAIHTQEGNTSSGTPEPLFGSPTLSMLQSQLMQSLNTQNPNGTLTSISSGAGSTLSGSMTVQVGGGTTKTITMGGNPANNTSTQIYTGGNTLADLAGAINSASADTPVAYTKSTSSSGTMSAAGTANLAGSLSIQVGSGAAVTVNVPTSGDETLTGLAAAISANASLQSQGVTASVTTNGTTGVSTLTLNASGSQALTVNSGVDIAGIGFTASVVTSNGESTLSLNSLTTGSSGALNVSTSGLTANPGLAYTSTTSAMGTLGAVNAVGDTLSGSMTVKVGNGTTQTIVIGNGTSGHGTIYTNGATLASLQSALSSISGITVTPSSDGTSLSLTSTSGNLTVAPSITDNANVQMSYTNSSDISTLANLGITVSSSDNGSISFDVATLDSALNTNFSGVVGFFQSLNSWGQNFSTTLNNAGISSTTGTLSLASTSNSHIESTLNADISREEALISAQQKSLTNELNSANEVLQSLPSQLSQVNELYSAITGYNQSSN